MRCMWGVHVGACMVNTPCWTTLLRNASVLKKPRSSGNEFMVQLEAFLNLQSPPPYTHTHTISKS